MQRRAWPLHPARGYSGGERPVGNDGISIDLPDGSVIGLTKALPDLTESVSISGSGADKLAVSRSAGPSYRIFNVTIWER